MKIACLHTAESNIAVFEKAGRRLGIAYGVLQHQVRAELLAAAERAGGLTLDIELETRSALIELARHADAVILTCLTLGPAVAAARKAAAAPVLRADQALAEKAAAAGGRIVALCAIETTVEPTTRLFADSAKRAGAFAVVRLVPGAWALFRAGDRQGYLSAVGKAADAAYDEGASLVALAQASMADAAELVRSGPEPLSSPISGLASVLEELSRAP